MVAADVLDAHDALECAITVEVGLHLTVLRRVRGERCGSGEESEDDRELHARSDAAALRKLRRA
jgi:hypothetical protein